MTSRAPIKVSHSISIKPPASSTKPQQPPAPVGNRRRSASPKGLPSPVKFSTPQPSRNASAVDRSVRSVIKSTPHAESDVTAFNLTPIEILQVAKFLEDVDHSGPTSSLKMLIRRVRTEAEDRGKGICDRDLLCASFLQYPSFSTSGFGSVGQHPLDSTVTGVVLGGRINEFDERSQNEAKTRVGNFLEDFNKPPELVRNEQLAKTNKELRQQRLERSRLRHLAERNEILSPKLISTVHADIESMTDTLDKFYTSPAFPAINDPSSEGIPCPVAKRKEMIQMFENLEKISSTQFSTDQKIDAGKLEEFIQHLISKTTAKSTSVEESMSEVKTSSKRAAELLDQLEYVKKL